MSNFFTRFPPTYYTFDPTGKNLDVITNLLFRTKLFSYIRNNTTAYYTYPLQEGDTPEIVAEQYYGTSDAFWLVLYSNDIVDPQFDWLLNTNEFNDFIIGKYGSVASAMTTPHHYQKVIETIDSGSGISTFRSFDVDLSDPRTLEGDPNLPYDTYNTMPDFFDVNPKGTFSDGSGVEMFIRRNIIYCYDYEYELNESKRTIKLVRKEYWPQIMQEFQTIAEAASPNTKTYIRSIKSI